MGISRLRKDLEKQKNKTGLVGTQLELGTIPGNSLSAHITQDWRTISIEYGEHLELIPDEETKRFAHQKKIADPELKVGSDILDHEAGHRENPTGTRRGCPYTVEMHDSIKESIHRALNEKGKSSLTSYVTHAFEDILDNINCRTHTDFAGQTLFWNNQGLTASKEGKYNPFYEAFVKINMILGGNIQDTNLLKRFYTNKKEVSSATLGFLADVKSQLGLEHIVRLHERKTAFHKLYDYDMKRREDLWTDLAYRFALHTADLLDENNMPKEQMFGAGEGSGEDSGNPFDKAMRDPANRQKIAFSRYSEGKGPAEHRDMQEQLYDLYKRISKDVIVKTRTYADAQSMPLVHYGRRFATEEERKLRFKGVGITENGDLGIKTTRHTIDYPVSYKTHPTHFPRFKLVMMDRSGSMASSPDNDGNIGSTSFIPWGDNSKYHYALKGYFGIENYLERQGIIPYIGCGALGFSGEAAINGDAKTVAKSLLTKPSGGTSLDIDGLEAELDTNTLVLSMSDGEMTLTEEIKTRFEKKVKTPGVDYAHIQIGSETAFSQYLRSIGIIVIPVKGDDDLSRTMIDFVSQYYKNAYKGESR